MIEPEYRVADPAEELYRAMIAVSAHTLDKTGLAELLRRLAVQA